jgi:8-oxo-dGTP diphosphatase
MPSPPTAHIEVIARGLLLRDGEALLCRDVAAGYLYLPGGHVEFDEPAAAALEREFVEECGLEVRAGPLLLVTEERFDHRRRHHEVNLVFHVEPAKGPAPDTIASREKDIAFEWIPLAAAQELDVRPESIRAWLAAGGAAEAPSAGWVSGG